MGKNSKSESGLPHVNTSRVSVIIPSMDGSRNGNVEKLKSQLSKQTLSPIEVIVVTGVSPNGKARNEGAEKASGDYYVFIDDDVTLGNENVLENLIRPLVNEPKIGMTGPSQLIPEDSNPFQKSAARQIPRSLFPVQDELVDSDMVSHMCLAIPAAVFKSVGRENPDIISGTDPDLRYRVRNAGFRVCVVPQTWAFHPMPKSFMTQLNLSFLKGYNSSITRRQFPNLVFELDRGFKKDFAPRRTLAIRFLRAIFSLFAYLFKGYFIGFSAQLAYMAGAIYGSLTTNPRRL